MKFLLPLWLEKVLVNWYQNLKAETPKLAKIIRNSFIGIGSTCVALFAGYSAMPERVQMLVPDKILIILAIGSALGILFSQSFKIKEP